MGEDDEDMSKIVKCYNPTLNDAYNDIKENLKIGLRKQLKSGSGINMKVLIEDYSKAMEDGRAAVFAGAGLSVDAGFVDWAGHMSDVYAELGLRPERSLNLGDVAQFYENENKNRARLNQLIINSFPGQTPPTDSHQILASLPIRTYWTTNFDKLIERSLESAGKNCDVKSSPSSLAISKSRVDAIVYKMHGDVDNPAEAIITRNQYEKYERTHKAFLEGLSYDLTNKTFLFLGLSFDDPNLKYVMKHIRLLHGENLREHYYILKSVCRDANESEGDFANRKRLQELFVDDLKNYGIRTVLIKEYSEINGILREIRKRYLTRAVFFSGAAAEYGKYGESQVREFVRKLSASIVHEGFRIVNGYGLGFGNEVLAGAISQLNEEHKPIDGNLFMRPFPQDIENPKDAWHRYREEMISMTGVSIFLLGNKIDKKTNEIVKSDGMRDEYEISKANGNLLIPVGATRYMAEDLWKEQMEGNPDDMRLDKEDMRLLGNSELSLDELHDNIIRILKEQTCEL